MKALASAAASVRGNGFDFMRSDLRKIDVEISAPASYWDWAEVISDSAASGRPFTS